MNPECYVCGEPMTLAVSEKGPQVTKTAWGSPRTNDDWRCPNGHRRPVTDAESRWFE